MTGKSVDTVPYKRKGRTERQQERNEPKRDGHPRAAVFPRHAAANRQHDERRGDHARKERFAIEESVAPQAVVHATAG